MEGQEVEGQGKTHEDQNGGDAPLTFVPTDAQPQPQEKRNSIESNPPSNKRGSTGSHLVDMKGQPLPLQTSDHPQQQQLKQQQPLSKDGSPPEASKMSIEVDSMSIRSSAISDYALPVLEDEPSVWEISARDEEGVPGDHGIKPEVRPKPKPDSDELAAQAILYEKSERHRARKENCKIKRERCRKKSVEEEEEEEEYNNDSDDALIDSSSTWLQEGPLPVVRGIPAVEEDCNAYCRWLKRQLVLDSSGDKSDAIMTLRELGEKYRKLLGGIRCVLVNLSGTLLDDNLPTQNAIKGVDLLRKFGIKIRYITNTTQEPKRLLFRRLIMLGFHLEAHELFTAVGAARKIIEDNKLRPYFLVEEAAMEDFADIPTTNPNAVVVGLSPTNFDYLRFNKALRLLMSGAPIIGMHQGKLHKLNDGTISLGPGPFINVLKYATSGNSYIVGKPSESFFRAAIATTSCTEEEIVVIGDDIRADIEGALKCGMKGILVKTGKYQENHEFELGNLRPTLVAKNFWIAVRCIVGAVAAEHGMKTGESDTEDPEVTRRNRIIKGSTTTNVEFLEKIQAYANSCGIPIWCTKTNPEEPHPPKLKHKEYYTADAGISLGKKKIQKNKSKKILGITTTDTD